MKNKINFILKYYCLIFISLSLFNCQENVQEEKDCSKYANEIYKEGESYTSFPKEALDYQKILLGRFGESSVKGLNYEAYHLQFDSSHGHGKSVKFENKNDNCSIIVKCYVEGEWCPDCKEYQIGIESEEWNDLEEMIYEFNFWTEEEFRANNNVLDGYAYILEGNRPDAAMCNKKSYKIVARDSPSYDKMGALCNYILDFESQLRFKYEQMYGI